MDSPYSADDEIARFLTEAKKMLREAQMVAEAVPNVNIAAVDRAARQLYGIRLVLRFVDDPFISRPELDGMIQDVADLMQFLEQSAERLAAGPVPTPNIILTLQQGQPTYNLDLDECERLHSLGNSWESVAQAMGVSRQTIVNHFRRLGRSTARPAFDSLDDDELDELISFISLQHPFIGQRIMLGHLEAQGVHVPISRVQESLRRVDDVGVLLR